MNGWFPLQFPECGRAMIRKVLLIATLAPTGDWISLFNGKNLDDWTAKIAGLVLNDNYRNTFRVEDGLLKVSVSYEQFDKFGDRFESLFNKRKFSHYWILAEYRFVGALAHGAPRWGLQEQRHSTAQPGSGDDAHRPAISCVGGIRYCRRVVYWEAPATGVSDREGASQADVMQFTVLFYAVTNRRQFA